MAGEEDDYTEEFFSTLSSFQRQGTLVDVIVEVENEQFPSHRLVLSIFSPYFRAMFSSHMREEREELVHLSVLSAEQFRLAHDFMYGRLRDRIRGLDMQTAVQLAEAANYLDMKSLLRHCSDVVIKETSLDSMSKYEPDIYETCWRFNMTEAIAHLDAMYFVHLNRSPSLRECLLKLPSNRLVSYVCSDQLRMHGETEVMALVRQWCERHAVASPEEASTAQRLVNGVRFGLLVSQEQIESFVLLCELAGVPLQSTTPCASAAELQAALGNHPFWRILKPQANLTSGEFATAKTFSTRSQARALLEVAAHVTFQDSIFTLRFCHVSGPKGIDYTAEAHAAHIPPRLCMSSRRFISTRLHRTTSLQWHCCSRQGFLFMYVEQAMEPACQAPGVLCVFDSAREVFHCFDGVTPMLSMMSIASSGDSLYVMGGLTSATYSFRSVDSIFAFNFRKFGWSRLDSPTLPQPAHAQAAAELNNFVYISGGICVGYSDEDARQAGFMVGRPLDCLWRLPEDASEVKVLAPMLQSRYQHRLLACRDFLYAVGGVCEIRTYGGNQQGGIERYDPRTNQWTALDGICTDAAIPPAVRFFGPVIALEADGCIYAMGRGSSPPSVGLWQFDPEEIKWRMIQILSWDKQQMLTSYIPWSCLNSPPDQNETKSSLAKFPRKNHVKEEWGRNLDDTSRLPPRFG